MGFFSDANGFLSPTLAATLSGGKPSQSKSVTINANGETAVTPDAGYVLSEVDITTDVQPSLQNKSISITENGTTTVTPDAGYYGLSEVEVTTDIATGNALPAVVSGTVTTISAADLAGATAIRDNAFYRFGTLQSIAIPSSVMSIGQSAFYNCAALTSVTIPSSVTSIGQSAFFGCTALQSVTIPSSVTSIGNTVFSGCTALTSVTIPSSVTSMGTQAFYNCAALTSVTIPSSVTNIDSQALSNCTALTSVTIPSSVTSIGYGAFQNSTALTSLTIGEDNVSQNITIRSLAFDGLRSISSFACYADITSLGVSSGTVFRGLGGLRSNPESNILTLDFRTSTFTRIYSYTFSGSSSSSLCSYMVYKIPSTVATIDGNAFAYNNHAEMWFLRATPATLAATTVWNGSADYLIFAPYNSLNAYKTATNWAAQASYIIGYAPENTFTTGDTLPATNSEGYALTWYSDKELTTVVTTVADGAAIYYCTIA